jgi:hypothetical protein
MFLNHEIYFLYNSPVLFCNPKTQERKGPILYNTSNEIISLIKKWMYHFIITKTLRRKWTIHWKEKWRNNLQIHMAMQLSIFVLSNIFSKRIICSKNCLLRTWACRLFKIIYQCTLWKVYGWTLCLKFVSKTCISFQKTIFTIDAPWVGEKN